MFKPHIFREYDIRGTVDEDFDADFAHKLGHAFAELVHELGAGPKRVAVGYDCRLSSPKLSQALMSGFRDCGIDVLDTGMGPTPQLYYMVYREKLAAGIQITGSHNPGHQNGFKMMLGEKTLSGADIQDLRKRVERVSKLHTVAATLGNIEQVDARDLFIEELINRSKSFMGQRRLKVVADAGNGVGGLVGPAVLRGLGCEVIELFSEPDGSFPNHHPDPTVVENLTALIATVKKEKADVGIAWDGDADRIGIVDENGEPIFGDMLLLLYGRQLLREVKNPTIIGDVKCSENLFKDLTARGANAVMAKTGHSLIKAKLKELHAELAGEMSGHMFFKHRYFGYDDALHASARLVEILSQTKEPLSSLLFDVPKTVSTPEIRVDCEESIKFKVAEEAKNRFPEYKTNPLDGVRITFEHGWGLVRASNTQPVLVMRFEADTTAHLNEYQKLVEGRIKQLEKELLTRA